jgi:hypothetical protein
MIQGCFNLLYWGFLKVSQRALELAPLGGGGFVPYLAINYFSFCCSRGNRGQTKDSIKFF